MIRANIYGVGGRPSPEAVDAVREGLELFSPCAGGIAVQKVSGLSSLPTNDQGKVMVHRVGYQNLDPMIELHTVIADYWDPDEPDCADNGVSFTTTGISWVRDKYDREAMVRTTAHEIPHALGFLQPAFSVYPERLEGLHCRDDACYLSPAQRTTVVMAVERNPLGKMLGLVPKPEAVEIINDHYCGNCQSDFDQYAAASVARLRILRTLHGMPTAKEVQKFFAR